MSVFKICVNVFNNGFGVEAVVGEELGFMDELMSECV